MTTEVNVPSSDHIARYCKPTTLTENGTPTGASFCLRLGETSLSVNWLEYLDDIDRGNALKQLRAVYAQKFRRISAKAKMAVLNVEEVITHVYKEYDRLLSILHEPTGDDPSHSGIYNLPVDEEAMLVGELIAEKVCECHNAR